MVLGWMAELYAMRLHSGMNSCGLCREPQESGTRPTAKALLDAATNKYALEVELVASFHSMGFDNVIKIGGSGKPDGLAEAKLGGTEAVRSPVLQMHAGGQEQGDFWQESDRPSRCRLGNRAASAMTTALIFR